MGTCRASQVISFLSTRWTLLILHNLCTEPRSFSELKRLLGSISSRTLTIKLQQLEEAGFIHREELAKNAVRYHLTKKGKSIKNILIVIEDWATNWWPE